MSMNTTSHYTCDQCGKREDTTHPRHPPWGWTGNADSKHHWCSRECLFAWTDKHSRNSETPR